MKTILFLSIIALPVAAFGSDFDNTPDVQRQLDDMRSDQFIQRESMESQRIDMEFEQRQMQRDIDDQRHSAIMNAVPPGYGE